LSTVSRQRGYTDLSATVDRMAETVMEFRLAMEEACQIAQSLVMDRGERGGEGDRSVLRITAVLADDPRLPGFRSAIRNVFSSAVSLHQSCRTLELHTDSLDDADFPADFVKDVSGLCHELLEAAGYLHTFLEDLDEESVRWLEAESGSRPNVYFYTAPLDVGTLLQERLFDAKQSVVVTSATLTVNRDFSHTVHRLGAEPLVSQGILVTRRVESPFEYKKQALVCVPTDIEEIHKMSETATAECLARWITGLAEVSGGRMLVLFTSHRTLRSTYRQILQMCPSPAFSLLADGVGGASRHQLIQTFQQTDQAVLMGASSYWEGVDIPGDRLSLVVVTRLPFWPPNHPVAEARTEAIRKSGRNPFASYSLPQAVLRFQQGFGRLIRSQKDRGIFVVLDRRIIDARYGRQFLGSLPNPEICMASGAELFRRIHGWLSPEKEFPDAKSNE
jgi:ATP-dependent DNA helicase DinG